MSENLNRRYTPDGNLEQDFRRQVRDLLDLDGFTHDGVIFDEIRRLKRIEAAVKDADAMLRELHKDALQKAHEAVIDMPAGNVG